MELKIRNLLQKVVNFLVNKNSSQGNWEDVRSTAVVLFALSEVLKEDNVTIETRHIINDIIENSKSWLSGQARREERGISWSSEIWDTSLSIIALLGDERYLDKINLAINWLKSQKCHNNNSWYDEIWETSLALIAIIKYESSLGSNKIKDNIWIDTSLDWLCSFPVDRNGKYITPHYSAFILWLISVLKESNYPKTNSFENLIKLGEQIYNWFQDQTLRDNLWSSYIFSNSYSLYALSKYAKINNKSLSIDLKDITGWFIERQSQNGCYEDYEDSALAILALSGVLENIEDNNFAKIAITLENQLNEKISCFIGYCGKSKGTALIVKEHINYHLPNIKVFDWNWDFITGNILLSEIDRICNKSDLAIFLITKDDLIFNNDSNISAPRDNVVFEVGYFSARLGFNKTILLVEQGTKIPSDWGGILYFSFTSIESIPGIILGISRHLTNIGLDGRI